MGLQAIRIVGGEATSTSTALEASRVIKATPGTLYSLVIVNTGPDQYIQLHDAASLPADTAVPKTVVLAGANQNTSIDFTTGRMFSTGIVVCNSSTLATKTIGTTDCWFDAVYR